MTPKSIYGLLFNLNAYSLIFENKDCNEIFKLLLITLNNYFNCAYILYFISKTNYSIYYLDTDWSKAYEYNCVPAVAFSI